MSRDDLWGRPLTKDNDEPVGAWNGVGWFLGNRPVTIDEAYERVFAG